MKKVWIAQLKCPSNHCVIALAGAITDEETSMLEAKLWEGFNRLVDTKKLNYECFICKATKLHAEVKRTGFDTLELAIPVLREAEEHQLATATFLRQTKN